MFYLKNLKKKEGGRGRKEEGVRERKDRKTEVKKKKLESFAL